MNGWGLREGGYGYLAGSGAPAFPASMRRSWHCLLAGGKRAPVGGRGMLLGGGAETLPGAGRAHQVLVGTASSGGGRPGAGRSFSLSGGEAGSMGGGGDYPHFMAGESCDPGYGGGGRASVLIGEDGQLRG